MVWPWDSSEHWLYKTYKRMLKSARLPVGRGDAFHRMRRSVASHMAAGGFDATEALGHSSSAITKKSYLDPTIVGVAVPSQVLFRPKIDLEGGAP